MKLNDAAKAWTVRYTRPKTVKYVNAEPRVWQHNYCSVIISVTVERAVEILLQEFTDATIISINPGSTGPIMVDLRSVE